jgi:hypothetical protein
MTILFHQKFLSRDKTEMKMKIASTKSMNRLYSIPSEKAKNEQQPLPLDILNILDVLR